MRLLSHPNIVQLKQFFYSTTDKNEVYLNLVLEFVPETVYRASKQFNRMNQYMPILNVQIYMYQVHFGISNIFFVYVEGGLCSMLSCFTFFTVAFFNCRSAVL